MNNLSTIFFTGFIKTWFYSVESVFTSHCKNNPSIKPLCLYYGDNIFNQYPSKLITYIVQIWLFNSADLFKVSWEFISVSACFKDQRSLTQVRWAFKAVWQRATHWSARPGVTSCNWFASWNVISKCKFSRHCNIGVKKAKTLLKILKTPSYIHLSF